MLSRLLSILRNTFPLTIFLFLASSHHTGSWKLAFITGGITAVLQLAIFMRMKTIPNPVWLGIATYLIYGAVLFTFSIDTYLAVLDQERASLLFMCVFICAINEALQPLSRAPYDVKKHPLILQIALVSLAILSTLLLLRNAPATSATIPVLTALIILLSSFMTPVQNDASATSPPSRLRGMYAMAFIIATAGALFLNAMFQENYLCGTVLPLVILNILHSRLHTLMRTGLQNKTKSSSSQSPRE